MKKQILLYTGIYSDSAATFLNELDANKDNEVTVRINSPGGDPYSTYGMIAMANAMDNMSIQIDGQANSCAAYFVANAASKGKTEALDVSTMVFHRAASWVEKYPAYYTDAIKAELTAVNKNLRAIIESVCTPAEWLAATGTSLDDMFSMDDRKDVVVSAAKAKKLGIVHKVTKLSAARKKEIVAFSEQYKIAAFAEGVNTDIEVQTNIKEMEPITTLAQFKAQFPGIYAEAVTEGEKTGTTNERKRAKAWLKFKDVDPEAVTKAIAEGTELDYEVMADMTVKMQGPEYLAKMKAANVTVETGTPPDADKSKTEASAFLEAAKKQRAEAEKK